MHVSIQQILSGNISSSESILLPLSSELIPTVVNFDKIFHMFTITNTGHSDITVDYNCKNIQDLIGDELYIIPSGKTYTFRLSILSVEPASVYLTQDNPVKQQLTHFL